MEPEALHMLSKCSSNELAKERGPREDTAQRDLPSSDCPPAGAAQDRSLIRVEVAAPAPLGAVPRAGSSKKSEVGEGHSLQG